MKNDFYISNVYAKNHQIDDFSCISEALSALPEGKEQIRIFIRNGIYNEKLVINRNNVIFEGESAENTIITFSDYANMNMDDGSKRRTFRTSTFMIDCNDFIARNITFQNNSGYGSEVGQAIALYVDGDRIIFDNCIIKGNQDTLFTAPLPKYEYEKGGFTGPKEFAPRITGRHYYHKCLISGNIDFIFGGATAYFDKCEIFVNMDDELKDIYGYIAAASTPEEQEYGYVFNECMLTSNCPDRSVYLGRPWRNYAKTVYMKCYMGNHIAEEGWHDWGKTDAHDTIFYAEYNNYGDGYKPDKRPNYVKILTDSEQEYFSKTSVLSGKDNWSSYLSI